MTASAIYEGTVTHRRVDPIGHDFAHQVFFLLFDLDELPGVLDGRLLWSARRPALGWFRRADYLGDPARPLRDCVADLVQRELGERPAGPIRLLTVPRSFGHWFNPVSFYYCYDAAAEHVTHVVADVTNTPWGDSHPYVMRCAGPVPEAGSRAGGPRIMRESFDKLLHVSPFMGMDHRYRWSLTEPGEQLIVHIDSTTGGDDHKAFDATLSLRRRELTPANLRRLLWRYPFASLRVLARIYGHALRLKLKGAPYFPPPPSEEALSR